MVYKINKNTQAIMSTNNNYYRTKIIEENGVKYSPYHHIKIIDRNCTDNGASLKGRADTVMKILDSKSKLPIPIICQDGIYMFPTTSMRNSNCVWLSYYHIKKYIQHGDQVLIYLEDNSCLYVNTSLNIFDRQFKRTSQVIAYFHRLSFLDS